VKISATKLIYVRLRLYTTVIKSRWYSSSWERI